jgi:hypothetical protein
VHRQALLDRSRLEEKNRPFDFNLTVEKNPMLAKVKMFGALARQSLQIF